MNILIIDDDAPVARTFCRMLRGHAVIATTCAKDALSLIREGHTFDVILCDLQMPTMSGRELYQELAGCAPDQAARIVFTSGGPCNPADADLVAMRPLLLKPFSKEELSMELQRVLPLLPTLCA